MASRITPVFRLSSDAAEDDLFPALIAETYPLPPETVTSLHPRCGRGVPARRLRFGLSLLPRRERIASPGWSRAAKERTA